MNDTDYLKLEYFTVLEEIDVRSKSNTSEAVDFLRVIAQIGSQCTSLETLASATAE